jgi:hypothetical protein
MLTLVFPDELLDCMRIAQVDLTGTKDNAWYAGHFSFCRTKTYTVVVAGS